VTRDKGTGTMTSEQAYTRTSAILSVCQPLRPRGNLCLGGPLLWASLRWDKISGPAPLGLWSCTPLGWGGRRAAAMLRAAWRRQS
jgi:hypothetical protein